MTCKAAGQGYATPLGASVEAMLAAFVEEGADAVGVNCTLDPVSMLDLVRLVRSKTALPILAQPTAAPTAQPVVAPGEMGLGALALLAAGATAVGSCCGSEPAHIAAIARAVASQGRSLSEIV
jgi:methionine synthase I (cobalamin-dependent)